FPAGSARQAEGGRSRGGRAAAGRSLRVRSIAPRGGPASAPAPAPPPCPMPHLRVRQTWSSRTIICTSETRSFLDPETSPMNRRDFLGAAGLALSAANYHIAAAEPKPRVGLIGTGWYGKVDLL